jgi:hypothetical protein
MGTHTFFSNSDLMRIFILKTTMYLEPHIKKVTPTFETNENKREAKKKHWVTVQ